MLSVTLTAYDSHDITAVHVRECMNSSRIPDEIIVVNDGGDDSLREMLKSLEMKCNLIYARIKEDIPWNYNGACNLGFWLSSGSIIAIEDTDHIPWRDAYRDALQAFEDPTIHRIGFKRKWVPFKDALEKPFDDWEPYGGLGCNQMVALYRREVYADMKGQDERMRAYGWLAYDFKNRMDKLSVKSRAIHGYYIVKEGSEPNLERPMSVSNRKIYRQNANREHVHDDGGVLNFTFDVERWSMQV